MLHTLTHTHPGPPPDTSTHTHTHTHTHTFYLLSVRCDYGHGYLLPETVVMDQLPSRLLFLTPPPHRPPLVRPPRRGSARLRSCPPPRVDKATTISVVCPIDHLLNCSVLHLPLSVSASLPACVFIPSPSSFAPHLQAIC